MQLKKYIFFNKHQLRVVVFLSNFGCLRQLSLNRKGRFG